MIRASLTRVSESKRAWLIIPLALFFLCQALSFLMLAEAKHRQEAIPAGDGYQYFVKYHEANPPWADYLAGWNGQGYREIATNGYPAEVPRTEDGQVLPNPWAFYPLYPTLVKGVMAATGLEFGFAAAAVSLTFGALATVLLYHLLYSFGRRKWVAVGGVLSLLLWPSAPLFQLAYAEGLALFLLVGLLTCIQTKRYLAAIIFVFLLGLTRPVGPPDLALVLVHGLYLGRAYLLAPKKWPSGVLRVLKESQGRAWLALATASAGATATWPFVSYLATGENAFLEARASYSHETFFFSWFRQIDHVSEAYPLAPLGVMAFFTVWAVFQLRNRALPPVLREWSIVLLAYIMAVTAPVGNEYRYLMLGMFMFPFLTVPETKWRRRGYWAAVVGAGAVALFFQYQWVNVHWIAEPGMLRKNV